MQESEKLALAAHLYVSLRRATGRVTDVQWLLRDRVYAHEIIQLALAQAEQPDLQRWARKFEVAMGLAEPDAAPPEAADSALSTLSPPTGFGDSMLDSRLDSRLGPDSRIGDARPAGHDKPPVARYVGRLR